MLTNSITPTSNYVNHSTSEKTYPDCIQAIHNFSSQTVVEEDETRNLLQELQKIDPSDLEVLCWQGTEFRDKLVHFLKCATSYFGLLKESLEILKKGDIATDREDDIINSFLTTQQNSAEEILASKAEEILRDMPVSSCHKTYPSLWIELEKTTAQLLKNFREMALHAGVEYDEEEGDFQILKTDLRDKCGEIFSKKCLEFFEKIAQDITTFSLPELESIHALMDSIQRTHVFSYDLMDSRRYPRYKESLGQLVKSLQSNSAAITEHFKKVRSSQSQDTTLNKCKQLGKILLINALFAFAGGGVLAYGDEAYRSVGEIMVQASILDSARAVSAPVIRYAEEKAPAPIKPYIGDALYVGTFVGSGIVYNNYREPILQTLEQSARITGDRVLEISTGIPGAITTSYNQATSSLSTIFTRQTEAPALHDETSISQNKVSASVQETSSNQQDIDAIEQELDIIQHQLEDLEQNKVHEQTLFLPSTEDTTEILDVCTFNNAQRLSLNSTVAPLPKCAPICGKLSSPNHFAPKKEWQMTVINQQPTRSETSSVDEQQLDEQQLEKISDDTVSQQLPKPMTYDEYLKLNEHTRDIPQSFKDYIPSWLRNLFPTSSASSNRPAWVNGLDKVVSTVNDVYKKIKK